VGFPRVDPQGDVLKTLAEMSIYGGGRGEVQLRPAPHGERKDAACQTGGFAKGGIMSTAAMFDLGCELCGERGRNLAAAFMIFGKLELTQDCVLLRNRAIGKMGSMQTPTAFAYWAIGDLKESVTIFRERSRTRAGGVASLLAGLVRRWVPPTKHSESICYFSQGFRRR
jgi:hypothetical protein